MKILDPDSLKLLASTCVDACLAAGQVLIEHFNAPRQIHFKAPGDVVTDADRAAEAVAVAVIRRAYPEHQLLTEESGVLGERHDVVWVLDPLDGTMNYASGVNHFCVSLACTYLGQTIVGAIFDPVKRELFHGALGQGAFVTSARAAREPLQVKSPDAGMRGLCGTELAHSHMTTLTQEHLLNLQRAALSEMHGIRILGSAALDLAYVAAGRLQAFYHVALKPWDWRAGALLIQEAGGLISDFKGSAVTDDHGAIVTAAPALHERLRTALQRAVDFDSIHSI